MAKQNLFLCNFSLIIIFFFTEFDDCSNNPCLNGGTCTDLLHMFTCTCNGAVVNDITSYIAGLTCEKCKYWKKLYYYLQTATFLKI